MWTRKDHKKKEHNTPPLVLVDTLDSRKCRCLSALVLLSLSLYMCRRRVLSLLSHESTKERRFQRALYSRALSRGQRVRESKREFRVVFYNNACRGGVVVCLLFWRETFLLDLRRRQKKISLPNERPKMHRRHQTIAL